MRRPAGCCAVQCLDLGLLVRAEDDGIGGRRYVQFDGVAHLSQILALPLERHPATATATATKYLTAQEVGALINAQNRDRWTGRRDVAGLR